MAKNAPIFVCAECGAIHARWSGRCDSCGAWNTVQEETGVAASLPKSVGVARTGKTRAAALVSLEGEEAAPPRLSAERCRNPNSSHCLAMSNSMAVRAHCSFAATPALN